MDFYLTLPSNTVSPTNKTNNFRVTLPNLIDLSGQWEVALVEMMYPHSWPNLMGNPMPSIPKTNADWIEIANANYRDTNPNLVFFKFKPLGSGLEIAVVPPGHYATPDEFGAAISTGLKRQNEIIIARESLRHRLYKNADPEKKKKSLVDVASISEWRPIHECVAVVYNPVLKRMVLKLDTNHITTFGFSRQLQYMLGFDEDPNSENPRYFTEPESVAKYPCDLMSGFYALFVYCDLVENQIIGNVRAPLLRIVPTDGSFGDFVTVTFPTPHYVNILKKQFSTVEINIKDDKGDYVPFDFGKCILKLHFRKKRPIPLQ